MGWGGLGFKEKRDSSSQKNYLGHFLLWNIKEAILKTVGNKAVLVINDFHCMNEKQICFSNYLLLYSIVYVRPLKPKHSCIIHCMLNQIKCISKAIICNV